MTLRRATSSDAPAIAVLLRTTMRSLGFLPELHTPAQDLAFIEGEVLVRNEVWVAEAQGAVAGFVAFRTGWIDHLYVHPHHQGAGLGSRLLDMALGAGGPRQLWTFQANLRARAFYEARGFRPVQLTDGQGNEEKTPDVRYLWEP